MGKKNLSQLTGKENSEDPEKSNEGLIKLRKKTRVAHELNKRCILGLAGTWRSQWKYDLNVLPLELCPLFPYLFTTATTFSTYLQTLHQTQDPNHLFFLIKGLNALLTLPNPPIEPLIHENVHKKLLKVMTTPQLSKDCVGCYINLTSNFQCLQFVDEGLIEALLEILETCEDDLANSCIWCLGNVSGDSVVCRNLVYSKGAFDKIIRFVEVDCCSENAVWLISNLCKGKPAPEAAMLKKACKEVFNVLNKDEKIVKYALETLQFCTSVLAVLDSHHIVHVLQVLSKGGPNGFLALKIIGNLIVMSKDYAQLLIRLEIFSHVLLFLKDGGVKEKKESLLILSNLCVDLDEYLNIFLEHEVFREALGFMMSKEEELKVEAVWVLRNLVKYEESWDVVRRFGFFQEFMMVFEGMSPAVMVPALEILGIVLVDEGFRKVFEEGNGREAVCSLMNHLNISVRILALQVFQKFLGNDKSRMGDL